MVLAPLILRADALLGFTAIIFIFAVVWSTDIAAYFAGRAIGGPKLYPRVSPSKTWSGAVGAVISALVVGILFPLLAGLANVWAVALVAIGLSVCSQAGDLIESAVKRQFGAKDASQVIPGHGGLMDRLDGFWAAALAAVVLGSLRAGLDAPAQGLLVW
jgi:phosphatidate cytidylyltransferase